MASEDAASADRSIIVASDRAATTVGAVATDSSEPTQSDAPLGDQTTDDPQRASQPEHIDGSMRQELQRIQQALGGSILQPGRLLGDQAFSSSESETSIAPPASSREASEKEASVDPQGTGHSASSGQARRLTQLARAHRAGGPQFAWPAEVPALREAAAQLEQTANQLESLELYPQADSLRALAQRFRVDARDLVAGRSRSSTAALPMRDDWPRATSAAPSGASSRPDLAGPREPTPAPGPPTKMAQ